MVAVEWKVILVQLYTKLPQYEYDVVLLAARAAAASVPPPCSSAYSTGVEQSWYSSSSIWACRTSLRETGTTEK